MKVAHLCSYYIGSRVYLNFFKNLSILNVKSYVFVPIRNIHHSQNNLLNDNNVFFRFVKTLNIFTKFSLFYKTFINLIFSYFYFKDKDFDFIHAHTFYSDGFTAFFLSLLFKKKFAVTFRGTDCNLGMKIYPHYYYLSIIILKRASSIIFISNAHKYIFEKKFGNSFKSKIRVIPNGIDDFFIHKSCLNKHDLDNPKKKYLKKDNTVGLYIGVIDKNKNIKKTLDAFFSLGSIEDKIFYIVGGDYNKYKSVYGVIPDNYINNVIFLERLSKLEIIDILSISDFLILASHSETFGLVYIEAVSQCVPIIYSRGQGIDGYFKEGFLGYGCVPNSKESIVHAINKVLLNFPNGLKFENVNPASNFSWNSVSKIYFKEIYRL